MSQVSKISLDPAKSGAKTSEAVAEAPEVSETSATSQIAKSDTPSGANGTANVSNTAAPEAEDCVQRPETLSAQKTPFKGSVSQRPASTKSKSASTIISVSEWLQSFIVVCTSFLSMEIIVFFSCTKP